ncbi:MAG: GH3 auxin-responsive promoter family protein [Chloroflexota bacterium]|nr:GH3 auxin-responsive promoter family protein [Chloroflexota bacterium]
MATAAELTRQGRRDEVWRKYCGFLDLSLDEFMEIQKDLLMEQIQLLSQCELGRRLLGDRVPASVEEFRRVVPLTTYGDYLPYLAEKREDVLPEKPLFWVRTSGRSEEYKFKWVPTPERHFREGIKGPLASIILATCQKKGHHALEEGDKFLYCVAPLPYGSGSMPYGLAGEFLFEFLPSVQKAEKMSFQERIEEGFRLALVQGLDVFYGMSSVLVRIGEQFSRESGKVSMSAALLHPQSLYRLAKGVMRSKLAKRPMLPRDLWTLKGLVCGGMDTAIYREKIKYYWGTYPLEFYGSTETGLVATQTWDYGNLTFFPDSGFLEFIPEEEHLKARRDPRYQPQTVLLNEVKAGKRYELVSTNYWGGIFVRYRVGDMIKIVALRNDNLNIDAPQMVFEARSDNVIDIAGFTRLTEKVAWQAMEDSRVPYRDWVMRKEIVDGEPALHLYVELKEDGVKPGEVKVAVHESLKSLDSDYSDLEKMLGLKPLHVSLLPQGTFQRYFVERQASGADLAQLKPPHMNPSDEITRRLLEIS